MRTLAQVDADLVVAYASRSKAMQATSYGVNGRTVTRNLAEINATIRALEAERAGIDNANNGRGNLQMIPTVRGW